MSLPDELELRDRNTNDQNRSSRQWQRQASPSHLTAHHMSTSPPAKGQKKKVGFLSDQALTQQWKRLSPGSRSPSRSQLREHFGPENDEGLAAAGDYDVLSPAKASGATPTGLALEHPVHRDDFDREEVKAALDKILSSQQDGTPDAGPSRPRPVLRKQTVALESSNREPLMQQNWSEVAAKNRADKLATALSSTPASRRTSFEFEEDDCLPSPPIAFTTLTLDASGGDSIKAETQTKGVRARRISKVQQMASDLIRSHTVRLNNPASPRIPGSGASGTATPVPHDVKYVMKPKEYYGGVFSAILGLYGAANQAQRHDSSTSSTPSRTPQPSPPSSVPSTPRIGLQRERPRNWLNFGKRAVSNTTLADLVGSSATLAAPGSSRDASQAMEIIINDKAKMKEKGHKKSWSRSKKMRDRQSHIENQIAAILLRQQYLTKLCDALMTYGAPTHRLEAYMTMSANALQMQGQFLYLPGAMIISFDDASTHTTEVKIVRAAQGVDLGRLRDVHEIYKQVAHNRFPIEEALLQLEGIIARKPKFSLWTRILLYGLASASVAPFGFEGRYIDMPIAFFLGMLVGVLQLRVSPRNNLYANVFEITASVLTSFLARMFGSIRHGLGTVFCFSSLAQSSIALILPGYMVLMASLELQSRQLVAGSVRLVYALIYTLFLGYGITLGSALYGFADKNANSDTSCSTHEAWYEQRPPKDWYYPFVLVFTLCLCTINQAHWKQMPVMVAISMAGYASNNAAATHIRNNTQITNSVGALVIGVLANLYSRTGRSVETLCDKYISQYWQRLKPSLDGQRRHRYKGVFAGTSPPYQRQENKDLAGSLTPEMAVPHQANHSFLRSPRANLDIEQGPQRSSTSSEKTETAKVQVCKRVGYSLAAAAMLPAIFVQVPSGLAVQGSLLSGVSSADSITRNETLLANGTVVNSTVTSIAAASSGFDSTAFNVLGSVIQIAIGISVGLSMSALVVYPYGKNRKGGSGLMSM